MQTLSEILNIDPSLPHQDKVKLRWDYVQQHKDEEHWEYAEYITSAHGNLHRKDNWTLWETKEILISTKGRVAKKSRVGELIISHGFDRGKYKQIELKEPETDIFRIRIHRCVGSTFIPIPDDLLNKVALIVVDHDDDQSHNNDITNLNWMMNGDNTRKAFDTGACKIRSVIAEWVLDDEFQGQRFYLESPRQYLLGMGIDNASVVFAMKGKYNTSFGFKWEVVEKGDYDLPTELPEEIKIRMLDKRYTRHTLKPVLATVISECSLEGLRFALYGQPDCNENGFSGGTVRGCVEGKRTKHKGCVFKECSRLEANKYQRGLTDEQRSILFNNC